MAFTDIVFSENFSSFADRGDIGTLVDITHSQKQENNVFLEVPVVGDVKSGVVYGHQGTELTGTYVAGGGSNTYSRGRVVNT